MVLTGELQALDNFRKYGFLELTGEVEAFLICQSRVFFDDRGKRLERVACEAKAVFADYLHRLPAAAARVLFRHAKISIRLRCIDFPSQQLFKCLQLLDCIHYFFVCIECAIVRHRPNVIEPFGTRCNHSRASCLPRVRLARSLSVCT